MGLIEYAVRLAEIREKKVKTRERERERERERLIRGPHFPVIFSDLCINQERNNLMA